MMEEFYKSVGIVINKGSEINKEFIFTKAYSNLLDFEAARFIKILKGQLRALQGVIIFPNETLVILEKIYSQPDIIISREEFKEKYLLIYILYCIAGEDAKILLNANTDWLTTSEVAKLYNQDNSTIRKKINREIEKGKIVESVDCRKSSQGWLIRKDSIKKIYSK